MNREEAEKKVLDAVLNLAEVTCAHGFCLPIPNTTPQLYVVMDEAEGIESLIRMTTGKPRMVKDVNSVFFDGLVLEELRSAENDDEMRKIIAAHIAVSTRGGQEVHAQKGA